MTSVNHQCAVLGKPIAHSLSPVLHMAAYKQLGLDDWRYTRQEVGSDDFPEFLSGLDPSWAGLSLTMPLKRTIQPYGSPSDFWSKRLHVANTAVFDWSDGSSKPSINIYNTDVYGIVNAFEHVWPHADGETGVQARAVILGNGNTALSALAALTELNVPGAGRVREVTLCSKHPSHSDHLFDLIERGGYDIALHNVGLDHAVPAMLDADIVISALPPHAADGVAEILDSADADLSGASGSTASDLPPALLDVAYDPHPSALLSAWRRKGALGVGGEEMLLYQAFKQVELMTAGYIGHDCDGPSASFSSSPARMHGRFAPTRIENAMRSALKEQL